MLQKVISGGQTGADQAGLAAAKRFGIETKGWMPKGFRTKDGPNPWLAKECGLREALTDEYADRTELNVRDSHGTILLAGSFLASELQSTVRFIWDFRRHWFDVPMANPWPPEWAANWIRGKDIKILNVAGNAEAKGKYAKSAGIGWFTFFYLSEVFKLLGHVDTWEEDDLCDWDPLSEPDVLLAIAS